MIRNILLILLIIVSLMYIFYQNKNIYIKEGYESLDACLKQGYPKGFCFQVPIQACLTNCD